MENANKDFIWIEDFTEVVRNADRNFDDFVEQDEFVLMLCDRAKIFNDDNLTRLFKVLAEDEDALPIEGVKRLFATVMYIDDDTIEDDEECAKYLKDHLSSTQKTIDVNEFLTLVKAVAGL